MTSFLFDSQGKEPDTLAHYDGSKYLSIEVINRSTAAIKYEFAPASATVIRLPMSK